MDKNACPSPAQEKSGHNTLSVTAVIELAAPHTWGASIVPVILGALLSLYFGCEFSVFAFFSCLLTAVLLQCSVNTLNDYVDFVRGADSAENCIDPSDAAMVYRGVRPKSALLLGFAFALAALVFGLYAIFYAGWQCLIFGAVGLLGVTAYSWRLSGSPVGEPLSGVLMGGVIALAAVFVFTGRLRLITLLFALPEILTIALIMLTNNACDIEKDLSGGRKTLAGRIGRSKVRRLHGTIFALSAGIAVALLLIFFPMGAAAVPFIVFMLLRPASQLRCSGLLPEKRVLAMTSVISAHLRLNLLYCGGIAAHLLLQ